jgi:mono/diheme cytochrome c family protein
MLFRYGCGWAALLLSATAVFGQADQMANVEKQKTSEAQKEPQKKTNPTEAIAAFLAKSNIDKEAAERGRKIFVPTCGFCHGNDARGKSGPDLVRSPLALHDNKGDTIGPVIREGRPDRGMPPFAALTADQIADISMFLHARADDVSNRFAYKIGDVVTGNAQKGAAFFSGDGRCANCHSVTGDLAHVASKYDEVELQRRMLYPMPSIFEAFLGKATTPPKPAKVTVKLASGEQITGTLIHQDEFWVSLHDADGRYRSFSKQNAAVEVEDPRAEHEALLPKYTDEQMHNILAYLETLK